MVVVTKCSASGEAPGGRRREEKYERKRNAVVTNANLKNQDKNEQRLAKR